MPKRYAFGTIGVFVVVALCAMFYYGLFHASDPMEIPSALIGKKAAEFQFTTFDGKQLTLGQFRGKPVILNFWASWCVECRTDAIVLETAYRKWKSQGAVFIGIAFDDEPQNSVRFIEKYGKTFLLAPDSAYISLEYGVTGVPETFFINREGVIAHKQLGTSIKFGEKINQFLVNQLGAKTDETNSTGS